MSIVILLLVITLVIAIHELGHYWACRACGVPVREFSVGFGPKLLGFRTSRTAWNLRAIPLGGYVSMDPSIADATPTRKIIIALAGPAINLVPFVLLGWAFVGLGATLGIFWSIFADTVGGLVMTLLNSVDFLNLVPSGSPEQTLSGPVGMGGMAGSLASETGPLTMSIIMFVLISVGVGLFNLIPLPPLDGGRIMVALAETSLGKERAERLSVVTSVTGVILLLWLFAAVTLKDVSNLV